MGGRSIFLISFQTFFYQKIQIKKLIQSKTKQKKQVILY